MLDERAALREITAALEETGKLTGPVTMDTNILKDLNFDSVGAVDFIMVLETRLDIIIPMDRMTEIETIGDLVRVVTSDPSLAS
ncbi:Acyl carrier protein (plasmid) [Roseomonas mucosa]|uniref:Acyl carrier protein n=2 Tax=Roseomonas mucosa TaxID=207340 RepID=A0A1S8D9J7_9PROT|nr:MULTISPECIES: acyl carrier protein [Roseomonas]ATR19088.1 acyl carrier protein [Roseomonas sp. FDAARGOS_362]MBS5904160.1 acyl carrier protein [Acetobacteraceae bacterium]MDT8266562.1 acyl carrier protein [Roseomonas sp. DSM 102946]GAV36670.1 acyl carrier protein [Roseomonas sp. TAS13]AWV20396.1 Acyl carrier protein [Roseomonas mucosa]